MAWLRTRLAVERTFMAWLRTAASMIGFGFTIVEFLARVPGARSAALPQAPRVLGLALIGAGVIALVAALVQFRWTTRQLETGELGAFKSGRTHNGAVSVLALGIILIGLYAFASILFRGA